MNAAVSRPIKIVVFLVYVAIVAWLCFGNFKPGPDIPRSIWGIPIDKCLHFVMFLPFPILGTLAFDFRSWWRALAVSMLMANVVAFLFERLNQPERLQAQACCQHEGSLRVCPRDKISGGGLVFLLVFIHHGHYLHSVSLLPHSVSLS